MKIQTIVINQNNTVIHLEVNKFMFSLNGKITIWAGTHFLVDVVNYLI